MTISGGPHIVFRSIRQRERERERESEMDRVGLLN